VLHVVGLATDQAAEMKNDTLSLITLTKNSDIGVLQSGEFLLVAFAFALKLFGDLLLEDKRLESIITLLLGSREASSDTRSIVLLLVNETRETSVFTLVVLNLDFEILSLFGKLLSESLEFEELAGISNR
jgi:hypothetical protein